MIRKRLLLIAAIILIIGSTGAAVYFYYQYSKVKASLNTSTQSQIKDVLNKVGKFIDLPNDEDPSIATITDVSKLKGQPFFVKARNGDMVIVYNKAKRAILYRPSENKIIDFTIVDPNVTETPVPTPTQSPNITPSPTPTNEATISPIPTTTVKQQ